MITIAKYREELGILRIALLNEHEGYQFYKLAAEQASDQEAKQVFETLAEHELTHQKWLTEIYRDLSADKPLLAESFAGTPSPGIFTKESITNYGSLSVSALHVGLLMEKASIDYYKEAATKTRLEALKGLYLKLVDWEWEHLNALQEAYDYAKEEWFDSMGFSPA